MPITDHAEARDLAAVVARIPELRDVPSGRWSIVRLPGLTNRSYRLHAAPLDVVVRFPGAGTGRYLSRVDELHNARAAAAAGLAPEVLYGDAETGILVTRFVAAAAAPDPRAMGEALRKLHDSGLALCGAIDPLAAVDRYLAVAGHARVARLRAAAERVRDQLVGPACPCHGDPGPANWLLPANAGPMLVDWEFSGMADPAWDVAVVALELDPAAEALLLAGHGLPRRRLELFKPLVRLVAAAWANATLAAGNESPALRRMLECYLSILE